MSGRVKTEVFENDYVTGIGMSQFHLRVKSINNRSNMAGYLVLMLFARISTLIAVMKTLRMFSCPFSVVKCGRSKTLQKRKCGRKTFYPFSRNRKRRFSKTH